MESLPASLSQLRSIPTRRISVVSEERHNDNHPTESKVHEQACNPDDEEEDADDND